MKLYTYFRSSSSFRVRIALNLKGLEYEPAFIHLVKAEQKSANYKNLNPLGLIPALEVNDNVLAQSTAIIEYLDETHPTPPLLPSDPIERAQIRSMVALIACEMQPLNNLSILQYLKNDLEQNQASVDQWYAHWIARGFDALEILIDRHGGKEGYCFGNSITMADVFLVPQVWNALRFKCDLSAYKKINRIYNDLLKIEAIKKALPENQPDVETA